MRDPIFNPEYLAASQREIDDHRTQFENHQPALQYFDVTELPTIHSAKMPTPSVEGQQIEFIEWLNPYWIERKIHAIAVRYDGELEWVFMSVQDEFWGKQKIMS